MAVTADGRDDGELHPRPLATNSFELRRAAPLAVVALRVSETALVAARSEVGKVLDQLQMKLRGWRLSLDPEVHEWIEETKTGLKNGSIQRRVEKQPSAREIVEQWRTNT